jgi:hypothetical protein
VASGPAAGQAAGRGGGPRPAADEGGRASGNGNGHGGGNGHGKGSGNGTLVVIDGPDTVVAGEQARYRVHPPGRHTVVSWAVGGGSVSQTPDPAHPDELLLMADQPGSLTVMVRAREGMTERRATKPVTAVPDVPDPAPPFTPRLFLHGWGLVAIAVLIVGFAAALDALGSLSSSDFIALATSLAALLGVLAAVRGASDTSTPGRPARPAHRPKS